jgi:hypothetical protein
MVQGSRLAAAGCKIAATRLGPGILPVKSLASQEENLAERVGFDLKLPPGLQNKQCLYGFHGIQVQLPPKLKAEVPSDNQGFCHRFWKKQRVKSDGVYPKTGRHLTGITGLV